MLANKIYSEIEGIECYAAEKKPIENLLREEPFRRSIRKLRSILDIPDYEPPISIPKKIFKQIMINSNGFFINDESVGVLVSVERSIEPKTLIDEIYSLINFLENFWEGQKAEIYKARLSEKIFNTITIFLILATLLIVLWAIISK